MDEHFLAELFREPASNESKTIDEHIRFGTSAECLLIKDRIETDTEANDLLKNGILIETREGLKLLSLTDALTSGVGGLNLSVEDFQHVATQLLSNQPVPTTLLDIPPKPLESIAEVGDYVTSQYSEPDDPVDDFLVNKGYKDETRSKNTEDRSQQNSFLPDESVSESSSPLVGVSESANSDSSVQSCNDKVKRKGGWPKGRKRKPELYENRPPKAPSTGYVIYLNEKRKLHKNVPFSEVTKLLGNEWSKLSLDEKRAYLDSAEVDKKRYREELKIYRKSEAYQSYLRRKRLKSLQANGTEESDVDATDELDEEDNEELYCRVCDQWFVTLHNKKEHLHGRQHFQNISQFEAHSQCGSSSYSLDESSLDGAPVKKSAKRSCDHGSMSDAISKVFQLHEEREKEIKYLRERLVKQMEKKKEFIKALQRLSVAENQLKITLEIYKREMQETEKKICKFLQTLYV